MESEWTWGDLWDEKVRKGILHKVFIKNGRWIRFFILVGILIHFFSIGFVPTNSMYPNVHQNDLVLLVKTKNVDRGDVIFFKSPLNDEKVYLKRVIAKEGDKVRIEDGKVYVNNRVLSEPYIAEPPEYEREEVVVPKGKLYVLGDNRNDSYDSKNWGFVPVEKVKGKAVMILLPFHRISLLSFIYK